MIAVVSGGIDSVTMAHHLSAEGHQPHVLAVDYGQRHRTELEFARLAAERLGAPYEEADLSGVRGVFRGSSLTDPAVAVPPDTGPHRSNPNIVPNRNAVLLSVAFAVAVVENAPVVAFGVMADDIGPSDTSLEFLRSFVAMERIATRGYGHPDLDLIAPLAELHKSEVITLGAGLKVPWDETWTCFRGEEVHCGRCAACTERREAFITAGVEDPTRYAR
ncbi:7-cyano-7-deazaguanine synthase [Streptomyces sp. NBC_00963]|uniref:7-cyano-7-deazaguanine synthase n=1 Tax=Streptomyces sp. NBC_00963 TaxID=2903697 RepID=UPI0038663CEE|nr:7-cyano-7-deazaguanine synthase [Streptomyces sp. NBC_00963]